MSETNTSESIVNTTEFQMALAAATEKIQKNILENIGSIMASSNAPSGSSDAVNLAREIALAVSQMADQGTGLKRVAPEVLVSREEGQKEMERLLLKARELKKADFPKYRLLAAGYFKDNLVQPFQRDPRTGENFPTEIVYMGIPGLHMKPLNASAKAIYAAYMRSISNNADSEVPIENKPVWVTDSGVVIAGGGSATARAHGRVIDPMGDDYDPDAPDVGAPQDDDNFGILNQNDPRAAEIHVLGTIAEPARRTSAVDRAAKQARGSL